MDEREPSEFILKLETHVIILLQSASSVEWAIATRLAVEQSITPHYNDKDCTAIILNALREYEQYLQKGRTGLGNGWSGNLRNLTSQTRRSRKR